MMIPSAYQDRMGTSANPNTRINPLWDYQANPDRYSSYAYGGSNEAYQRELDYYRAQADAAAQQERIQLDPSYYNADLGLLGESNARQNEGLEYYRSLAEGRGPNLGIDAQRTALGNAMAQQQSMAAGSRGGAANAAAAARLADQQRAQLALGATNQQELLRAQAQTAGVAGMSDAANSMRSSAQGYGALSSRWAQANAQTLAAQRQQDLQQAQGYGSLAHQTNLSQQQGQYKGILNAVGRSDLAMKQADAEAQRQAASQNQWFQFGAAAAPVLAKGIGGMGGDDEPKKYGSSSDGSYWDAKGVYHP